MLHSQQQQVDHAKDQMRFSAKDNEIVSGLSDLKCRHPMAKNNDSDCNASDTSTVHRPMNRNITAEFNNKTIDRLR